MKEQMKLNSKEIASFFEQAALLFRAGIPPRQGMQILYNDCATDSGKAILETILAQLNMGESYTDALAATNVFPDYVIHMVKLGEEAGKLDSCMESLANYYEKEQSISENVRSAVTYPIVMIVMMLVVIIVLISKVMPIFQQVFAQLGSEMNGFAGSLMKIGNSLNKYSLLLLGILIVLMILYLLARHTQKGRSISRAFLIQFPLTKNFYESEACERFASGLAIAQATGMDTYASLDMVSHMVEHKGMEAKIEICRKSIQNGDNFAEALANAKIFNNLYSQMLSVGFRSGNADVVLAHIADNYEKEANKRIQGILSILEPTLVIILSVIVGMILLSVILPLMGIMSSIG